MKSRELGGSARIFADLVSGEAASKARGVRLLSQVKNTHSEFIILIIQNSTQTIIRPQDSQATEIFENALNLETFPGASVLSS